MKVCDFFSRMRSEIKLDNVCCMNLEATFTRLIIGLILVFIVRVVFVMVSYSFCFLGVLKFVTFMYDTVMYIIL